jgi:hypothetical protein
MKKTLIVSLMMLAGLSNAADIQLISAGSSDKTNAILISGEITKGDYDKFINSINKINNDKPVMVLLDGPGGSLNEAIGIGLAINKQRFSTIAYKGICASACAYIWLAGERSIIDIEQNARVGFHSPYYVDKFGNKKSDNTASAILGGYLRDIGAGYSVIRYATSVDGDSIRWLTESKSKEIGLSAEFYNKKSTPESIKRTVQLSNGVLTVSVNSQNQYHGVGIIIFNNPADIETINYVNGKAHGPARYSFANGNYQDYNYVNGIKQGEIKTYLSNGELIVSTYVNGSTKGQAWFKYNNKMKYVDSGMFDS